MSDKQEDQKPQDFNALLEAIAPMVNAFAPIVKIYVDANAVALKLVAAHKAGEGVTLTAGEVTSVVRIMAAKK